MGNLRLWMSTYLLALYLAYTLTKEVNCNVLPNTNTTALLPNPVSTTPDVTTESRTEVFDLESSVNLNCTNKTLTSVLFSIWRLRTKIKRCEMAISSKDPLHDTCRDGKKLENATNGVAYLHIPRFTKMDEGLYECEVVFKGGYEKTRINVTGKAYLNSGLCNAPCGAVPLQINTWLDEQHRSAVCVVTGAPPYITITWLTPWNSTDNTTEELGPYTVENRLRLPDHVPHASLNCSVMHPTWASERVENLQVHNFFVSEASPFKVWQWIVILMVSLCFLMGVLVGLFIIRTHISKIRKCCKLSISAVPPHTTEKDVEELEPYASYVQRINSIYNSSAELCNG